jgi:hypothetical protein
VPQSSPDELEAPVPQHGSLSRGPVQWALFATVLVVLLPAAAGSAAQTPIRSPTWTVIAKGLNNPRKMFLGHDGSLYVVEAGNGGRDRCLGTAPFETCVGLSGSITRVTTGGQQRAVTGLWSGAGADGHRAQGPADVAVRKGTYYVLLQDGVIDSHGRNQLGPDGAVAGDLVSTPPGAAAPHVIADLSAFEASHNPDRGAGPGARFGDLPIDSDPYAFTSFRGGYAIADAAGNDLLWSSPRGVLSVLAVFPTQTEKLTLATKKLIGAPVDMSSISMQSVPTCVIVGPDHALYVGELTGTPFTPGKARIWRIVPGRKPSVYASDFTTISDMAFDGPNLLVLEMSTGGLLDQQSPGALIRLDPRGKRRTLVSVGLVAPTGLAVGHGSIYISNYGTSPGTGSQPNGEVIRLPAALGSS